MRQPHVVEAVLLFCMHAVGRVCTLQAGVHIVQVDFIVLAHCVLLPTCASTNANSMATRNCLLRVQQQLPSMDKCSVQQSHSYSTLDHDSLISGVAGMFLRRCNM